MNTIGYGALRRLRKHSREFLSALLLLPLPAFADTLQIVALGDSLVQGYGLPPTDGFVPQLQNWLDERGHDTTIINAGVSGDTTTGARARLDWALSEDADAVIVSLGGNDILRAIDPSIVRENLANILASTQARGLPVLLVGINVPPNYGPDYQQQFQAIYPELAEEFSTEYYADFLQALLRLENRADTYANLFQRDGLHPNKNGIALIVGDMGPSVETLIDRAADQEP